MKRMRAALKLFQRTPLHPQWLLGRRTVPAGICDTVLDIGAADRWIQGYLSESIHYIALDYPATGRELYTSRPDVFAKRDVQAAGLQLEFARKTGHSTRAAGLLMCLAIAGGAGARGWPHKLLLPLAGLLVLLVNLVTYLISLVWPDWEGMAIGLQIEAFKP